MKEDRQRLGRRSDAPCLSRVSPARRGCRANPSNVLNISGFRPSILAGGPHRRGGAATPTPRTWPRTTCGHDGLPFTPTGEDGASQKPGPSPISDTARTGRLPSQLETPSPRRMTMVDARSCIRTVPGCANRGGGPDRSLCRCNGVRDRRCCGRCRRSACRYLSCRPRHAQIKPIRNGPVSCRRAVRVCRLRERKPCVWWQEWRWWVRISVGRPPAPVHPPSLASRATARQARAIGGSPGCGETAFAVMVSSRDARRRLACLAVAHPKGERRLAGRQGFEPR